MAMIKGLPWNHGLISSWSYGLVNQSASVAPNTNVGAVGFGGQVSYSTNVFNVSGSFNVAKVTVSTTSPAGQFTGSFRAEAIGVSAQLGVMNSPAGSGKVIPTVGARVEAHVAQTEASGSVKFGPVTITARGSTGLGAAAGFTAGAGKSGFRLGAILGLGGIVGGEITVSW